MRMNLKERLQQTQSQLAAAESLTGGMLSARIVNISGISKYYQGGVTTYSLQSKEDLLKVPLSHTTATDGVDAQTAYLMAKGVTELFSSDIGIATTGIAERWDSREEQAFVALFDVRTQEHTVQHLLFGAEIKKECISPVQIRTYVRTRVTELCLEMLMHHLENISTK